jgi:hypothetical protein
MTMRSRSGRDGLGQTAVEQAAANGTEAIEVVERSHGGQREMEVGLLLEIRDFLRAEHSHEQLKICRGFLMHAVFIGFQE